MHAKDFTEYISALNNIYIYQTLLSKATYSHIQVIHFH